MAMRFARRARFRRRAAILLLAALGTWAAWPPPSFPSPGDRKLLSLYGRVADPAGAPLADVRVEVTGTREATALTGPDGRFQLDLDLGSLYDLARRPAAVELRAGRPGYHVVVAGGEPALAIEVRLRSERGTPVLEARSNYGIIADAVLDALALPGVRTASVQVAFRATAGAENADHAVLPGRFSSVPVPEPWVNDVPPPAERRPSPPPAEGQTSPPPAERRPSPPPAPAIAKESTPSPAPPSPEATATRSDERSAPAETRRATRARTKKKRAPKPRHVESREPAAGSALAAVPLPAPATTNLDSIWQEREAERQAKIAAAQAVRDSIWAAQQAAARQRNAMMDSVRAVRAAREDSIRRARLGLPPERPNPPEARQAERPREGEASPPPFSPTVSKPSTPSGLQRVEPRPDTGVETDADRAERARLESDSCTCRVRGTVEMEFHRLLSSPLKVEVSIRELPALRDTVDLFMGSPRAFEMRRVPCGRWSLAVRPFSDRPFGVTTPGEVAAFDCRQRGLRQVRIVLAPVRGSR